MGTHETHGQMLDRISQRLDAASAAWKAAGYPDHGTTAYDREEAYYGLHLLNHEIDADPHYGTPKMPVKIDCEQCAGYLERLARLRRDL